MQDDAKPVAWMYENEEGSKELILNCNSEYAQRLLEFGYAETPLYAHPPAPAQPADVERLQRSAAQFDDDVSNPRDLAVEIVDGIRGYTCEFAASAREHEYWYDRLEALAARAALAAMPVGEPVQESHELPADADAGLVEPTPAMINRGVDFAINAKLSGEYTWPDYIADLYREMNKAAHGQGGVR